AGHRRHRDGRPQARRQEADADQAGQAEARAPRVLLRLLDIIGRLQRLGRRRAPAQAHGPCPCGDGTRAGVRVVGRPLRRLLLPGRPRRDRGRRRGRAARRRVGRRRAHGAAARLPPPRRPRPRQGRPRGLLRRRALDARQPPAHPRRQPRRLRPLRLPQGPPRDPLPRPPRPPRRAQGPGRRRRGRHPVPPRRARGTAKARREKEAEHAQAVLARYDSDEAFRKLYDGVADLFAGLLKSDLEHLRAGETAKIGLAAKWCPSLRSSYDRATLLCEAIARRVFPRDSSPEYLAIPDKHYAYRVRSRLRREVQVPLRKVLELPEVYMSARKWDELPYARVASTAMRQYKEAFEKHDKEGVAGFYDEVRAGLSKIPADAVLPHVIVAAALKGEHDESAELQWRHMVSSLASEGRLTNCIAMCALSGTSDKPPAAAAIALGLLISELSQDPWKGRVITFDATHQLHKVRGASLVEKLRPLAAVTPQRGANLQAVFNKILKVAVAGALAKDQMVRRVFVLSDMEFDGWTGGEAWVSEHEAIRKRFAAEGFAAPEVVFWNVGGTSKAASPVVAAQAGVALVSGYSKNLVRLFLEADGVLTPSAIMADAISGPEYDALEVLD
uniref:Uncharacterized protein n=1 Tax=Aegilops tauschii subsp. strangulata TaxID=200361 RepID=A0A453GY91_AEGTS